MKGQIPQGIEVLVLKAAIDPDFKQLLLQRRTAAAAAIGLELAPAEAAMLAAVPAAQLEAIIARTSVPQEHRRAFLGQAAAAMLAALAVFSPAIAAERAEPSQGIPPDPVPVPPKKEKTVAQRVIEIISNRTGVEAKHIKPGDALVKDLKAKPADLVQLRKDVEEKFNIKVPADDFKKLDTVRDVLDCVEKALKKIAAPSLPISRGVRPDRPFPAPGGVRPD